MSAHYTAVLWNKQKKNYDRLLWLGIVIFIISYSVFQFIVHPNITIETLIIRATALAAFILLHFILSIGPLARINTNFLPWLYNRRHAGVSMFLLAAVHGIFSIFQFHSLGDTNPFVSLFVSNQKYLAISAFPFQTLGFLALIIFLIMAVTSHDFWLKNLSPRIWKILHMGVYFAYFLILLHVALGAFQYETHPANWIFLIMGFGWISGLHLYSGLKTRLSLKLKQNQILSEGYLKVCTVDEIPESCAKTVFINGENIAIFKYDNKISAVNNICKHQQGPLGEGKIIDACITCPWHGYQYYPENGQSPPPFEEKITTYQVKIQNDQVWVNPNPKPEGTFIEATSIVKPKNEIDGKG